MRRQGRQPDQADRWRDRKRYLWPLGIVAAFGPGIAWLLVHYLSWGIFWAVGFLVFVVLIPLIDLLVRLDQVNPPDEVLARLEADPYYRWCVYAYLPVQYAGFFFGFWCLAHAPMATGERIAMSMTIAVSSAIAINVAHELGHKKPRLEKSLAKIALAPSAYGHFYIEHNVGHHVLVATPGDPASARLGESLWAFWPRAIFGGLRSGIRLERDRLRRQGKGFWTLRNDVVQTWLLTAVLAAAVAIAFGPGVLPWFVLQAAISALILEGVNYIEHYGLLRPVGENGRPGKILPEHSWNCDYICSNLFLYHLQRHSDHHANPRRRYQALRSYDTAPQMPAGYAAMLLLALMPPLWRRVMDPRVVAHYRGDVMRANVQPSRRERLLRRFPPPATERAAAIAPPSKGREKPRGVTPRPAVGVVDTVWGRFTHSKT
ncbi:alkane 1-monooxygenase [Gordonia sihwensis]|uniref:alkane 1-monooxygenase n=1 Tax=Gordonia sihwensis TaxID=173559 RepID=UPI0005EE2D50|nr:alkane 1-monooxygenase [Gordonia sihwensis]KJR10368.1 alkane 1-monooxygenase [Gordonia sihwensis]